eukprot:jgi/Tetstr1/427922/TSEL_017997.t1
MSTIVLVAPSLMMRHGWFNLPMRVMMIWGCDVNGAKDINGQVAAAFVRGCPLHMMRGRSVRRDRIHHVESGASS